MQQRERVQTAVNDVDIGPFFDEKGDKSLDDLMQNEQGTLKVKNRGSQHSHKQKRHTRTS